MTTATNPQQWREISVQFAAERTLRRMVAEARGRLAEAQAVRYPAPTAVDQEWGRWLAMWEPAAERLN